MCWKKRKAGYRLVRISFNRPGVLVSVKIIGSFTEQPWEDSIPLSYSLAHKELFVELWLRPGDMFKLKVRSQSFLHPCFPIGTDTSGREGNIIFPEDAPTQELRALLGLTTRPSLSTQYCLKGQVLVLPHEEKGEDAAFMTNNIIGIADGVSSWRKVGVDSGEFAGKLLSRCRELLEEFDSASSTASNSPPSTPRRVKVCLKTTVQESLECVSFPGSSTLLLAYLSKNKLRVYNLGDSCLVVIRMTEDKPWIYLQTEVQQYSFNTPYQVSASQRVCVEEGQEYEVQVESGDLVLAGTDGLWDNLFFEEILNVVEELWKKPRLIAQNLANLALERSRSCLPTPFQKSAESTYGTGAWAGGKPDDISVVAAHISTLT